MAANAFDLASGKISEQICGVNCLIDKHSTALSRPFSVPVIGIICLVPEPADAPALGNKSTELFAFNNFLCFFYTGVISVLKTNSEQSRAF